MWGVKYAPLDLLFLVVSGEEVFVEVDDRVLITGPVAEVAFDRVCVRFIQKFYNLLET